MKSVPCLRFILLLFIDGCRIVPVRPEESVISPGLELQVVISYLKSMLGTELGPTERTVLALNH